MTVKQVQDQNWAQWIISGHIQPIYDISSLFMVFKKTTIMLVLFEKKCQEYLEVTC